MTERYLDPTNDLAFKKVFMEKNRLRDFLNGVLRLREGNKIEELDFLPQEEVADLSKGKRSMFDIKCKDQKGNMFIIEMQNGRKSHFLKRVQFYGSHTYVSQLKSGISHSELMPVIVVVVIRENIFPESVEYLSYHKTKEDKTNVRHMDALSYVFIELSKFKKKKEELVTPEDYWIDFLANSIYEMAPPEQLDDPYVLEAYKTIERFNWSQASFDAYLKARLVAEAEEISLEEEFEKGRAKGIAEGEAKLKAKMVEVARAMLARNMVLHSISELTGLSVQEIERLKQLWPAS